MRIQNRRAMLRSNCINDVVIARPRLPDGRSLRVHIAPRLIAAKLALVLLVVERRLLLPKALLLHHVAQRHCWT